MLKQTELTTEELEYLATQDIHIFLKLYGIKTESGDPLDFKDHMYMWDIYGDWSQKMAIMKAAQITATTAEAIKTIWATKNFDGGKGVDSIYTLPTDNDRNVMVGSKVNRIIANNPILQQWTRDKDSIEQKQVGAHFIHYRGTWSQKAAIMIPSDYNSYDEVDASKQDVIEQYSTRQQHSKYKIEHYFSHPSSEGTGIHKYWERSDQKYWFIHCGACKTEQYMDWPDSIDFERKVFQCKYCKVELTKKDRRKGRWVAKEKRSEKRPFSGYWIPLLIAPWVTAPEILEYYNNKTEEYFYNKVLGLPYVGGGNKLTKDMLLANLTDELITPDAKDRVVMGVDTGLKLDYVMGTNKGLFYHGEAADYDELDLLMKRYPRMIVVIDAGGDLIGSRKFKERWIGRVFLCYTGGDKKNTDEPVWNDKERIVIADRNKMIQLVVDEFRERRIPLQGDENDWYDYWLDWNNLHRKKMYDDKTGIFKGFKWFRDGRDHRALATVYWRVGMTKFSGTGKIVPASDGAPKIPKGYDIEPDGTFKANLTEVFKKPEEDNDWRNQ